MNRREFSALLPLLATVASLTASEAQAAPQSSAGAPLEKLTSGRYAQIEPTHPHPSPRMSKHFLLGLLPDNIRLEAHFTRLAPGCPPEPVGTHKHTEIWFIHEGTARLMTAGVTRDLSAGDMGVCIAGDRHTIYNASPTVPASYFVLTVGPPE
ncbi:MAG TPA: cupin domain-containing protein [Terracidiphilus sp.]|jgi:mannose-6-phosphate isomerase-like protein (cupin superfamily)